MSWDWSLFFKIAGLVLLWILVDKIGDWLLEIWSPGDSSFVGTIFRVILFLVLYVLLWMWFPGKFF